MRASTKLGAVILTGAMALAAHPARAAQYHIEAGTPLGRVGWSSMTAIIKTGCNDGILTHPLNGKDSVVIKTGALAGHRVRATPTALLRGGLAGALGPATSFDASCVETRIDSLSNGASITYTVPGNSTYLLIPSDSSVGVDFDLTRID